MAIRNGYKSTAWRNSVARVLAAVFAGYLMAACSSPDPEIPETPVEILHNNAKDALRQGKRARLVKLFR